MLGLADDEMSTIRDISWNELNKFKFYVYGPLLSLVVRFLIHPLSLIKTRLQMQNDSYRTTYHQPQVSSYSGTFDAFRKILKNEGSRGLYKGFAVSSLSIFSGQIYVTTYEIVRQHLLQLNDSLRIVSPKHIDIIRNSIAGGCASLMSQTIVVPIDVISQKQMMLRKVHDSSHSVFTIPHEIFRKHGVFGFYKGYFASLAVYVPSSAVWWGCYAFFRENYNLTARSLLQWHGDHNAFSQSVINGCSAASAGICSVTITNPLDVARTRLQINGSVRDGSTLRSTIVKLWRDEGPRSFMKGVEARILTTIPSSILIISFYEFVKQISVN